MSEDILEEVTPEEVTPEEIATHYRSAMDSVNLVNELKALPSLNDEQTVRLKANVDHLEIMLSRDYWTDEDLTPFTDAVELASQIEELETP